MGEVFLVLMTLNARTGQIMQSHVLRDRAYESVEECMRAATEKGPQHATGDLANVYSCTNGDARTASNRSAT